MLGAGAMVYLYAQKDYFFTAPGKDKNDETIAAQEDQPEDIGTLTNDDPWKEIDKLVESYYIKEGVSYKGSVKLIDDNGDKEKIIEQHAFHYSTVGKIMYYQFGNIECITRPGLLLVADNENKLISISEQDINKQGSKKLFDLNEFKKLMEDAKAQAKVTQLGNQKILSIEDITDPQIQGYRIYYDAATYKISKMLIGMMRFSPLNEEEDGIEQAPADIDAAGKTNDVSGESTENEIETYTYYLEIIYDETKLLKVSEKTFDPETKFINKTENKIELKPAFNKYQLILNGEAQTE